MENELSKHNSPSEPEEITLLPKTYFEELAEEGLLIDFMENYMPQQFAGDELFRERVFSLALQYNSNTEDAIANRIILDINNALSYFLEYTKEWRNHSL